ncbi:MAG: type I 3-dehydroquinate dehydratase [Planctomycetaceae bacterium]
MICVSLGRSRHSGFQEGHQALAEQKAELVELRVDWLRKRPDVTRLLKDRPTPVVVTCRRPEDQGRWSGDEETRQAVLREAIIGGAEYVDLEWDIAKSIPRFGKTKRIVSYHNFNETPIELYDIYSKMTQCNPDIIKIVTMAKTPADNVRVLEMLRAADVPTVAFCMGEFGTISRILCGKMGAPFTYAGFSSSREMAPGQLTYAEVRNLYRFNHITDQTKIFGVIGDPIGHSLSPFLHNLAFRKVGFDGVYLPLKIPAELLESSLEEYKRLGISGYSVTIPHRKRYWIWWISRTRCPTPSAREYPVHQGWNLACHQYRLRRGRRNRHRSSGSQSTDSLGPGQSPGPDSGSGRSCSSSRDGAQEPRRSGGRDQQNP